MNCPTFSQNPRTRGKSHTIDPIRLKQYVPPYLAILSDYSGVCHLNCRSSQTTEGSLSYLSRGQTEAVNIISLSIQSHSSSIDHLIYRSNQTAAVCIILPSYKVSLQRCVSFYQAIKSVCSGVYHFTKLSSQSAAGCVSFHQAIKSVCSGVCIISPSYQVSLQRGVYHFTELSSQSVAGCVSFHRAIKLSLIHI